MLRLRLETKNIQPEQIKVTRRSDGDLDIDIPAGPWTRESVAYSTAYATAEYLVNWICDEIDKG